MREERVLLEDRIYRALKGGHLTHFLAMDEDLSISRQFEAGDHPQRGRFATAGWPQQRKEFAIPNLHRHMIHGRQDPSFRRNKLLEHILHFNSKLSHLRCSLKRTSGYLLNVRVPYLIVPSKR